VQYKKLMLSRECGEFLQYNMFQDGRLPMQPLCPALINAISGSWYKTARYDPASVPEQAADAFSGLARRGVAHAVAQKLAIACCNWLAVGVPWKLMLSNHHMFTFTQPKVAFSTKVTTEQLRACVPRNALAAEQYVHWLSNKYPGMIEAMSSRQAVSDMLDMGCFGSAVAAIRQHDEVGEAAQRMEQPAEKIVCPLVEPMTATESQSLCRQWTNTYVENRVSAKELLAFLSGLPASALEGSNTRQVIKHLHNEDRAKFDASTSKLVPCKAGSYYMMPGAMASAFRPC